MKKLCFSRLLVTEGKLLHKDKPQYAAESELNEK